MNAQIQYPEWFFFPARYDPFITAYSLWDTDLEEEAKKQHCMQQSSEVEGILETILSLDRGNLVQRANLNVSYDLDCLIEVHNRLSRIDFFVVNVANEDIIAAFSTDSSLQLPRRMMTADTIPRPAWVNRDAYRERDHVYGVGAFTYRANKNDAWRKAEEKALFALIRGQAVEVVSVKTLKTPSKQREYSDRISFFRIQGSVHQAKVLERWIDLESQVCYVLMAVNQNNIEVTL